MDDSTRRYAATMQGFRASACALVSQARRAPGFTTADSLHNSPVGQHTAGESRRIGGEMPASVPE